MADFTDSPRRFAHVLSVCTIGGNSPNPEAEAAARHTASGVDIAGPPGGDSDPEASMPSFRTRLTVALISAVTIALELMLMRVLSIRFWHHLSYLVISTALLGFGASGTLLTVLGRLVRPRRQMVLFITAMLLALAVALSIRAAERVPLDVQFLAWGLGGQLGYLVLLELIFLVPMLLAGTAVGVVLMDAPARLPGHYAANLVGSGVGALAAIRLLESLPLPAIMAALAGACWLAGAASLPRRRGAVALAATVGMLLLAVHYLLPWAPSMSTAKMLVQLKLMPGTKTIARAAGPLGTIEVVAGPAIHFAPALSLSCPEPIPPHAVLTIDGEAAGAIYDARGPAGAFLVDAFAFMDWTTAAAPYAALDRPTVLVLGAGGGGQIGLALYHRSRSVVAVEMNPQLIALMTGPLRRRGGEVYLSDPAAGRRVRVVNAGARGYLAGTRERFDLIQLSAGEAFGASGAGVYSGQETYLYTVQAVEAMLSRLTERGVVCITCWARTPPRDGLRIFAIAAEALRRRGREPARCLVMIRSWAAVTVMAFKAPPGPDRLEAIESFCRRRSFDICYAPGLPAGRVNRFHQLPRPYYYEGALKLLGPGRKQFLSDYVFDVRPTTDDRPYFFHFFRLRAWPMLRRELRRVGRAYLELGYLLLLATLAQCVPVSAGLILLPLARRGVGLRRARGKARALAYFLLIGLGFMMLEMSFLQRLTLLLAHPVYSAAVVIAAFLVFAGIGSVLSRRWRASPGRVVRRAGLAVAALAASQAVLGRFVPEGVHAWPFVLRTVLAVVAIAPLAFAMGQMFPLALRQVAADQPALVPWCWAINGFASVVATVAATLLAMEVGFTVVTALGAGAYVLAAGVFREVPRAGATGGDARKDS